MVISTNFDPGIGPKLRVLRKVRELTLAEVQEATGIPPSYISRIENGIQVPTPSQIAKLKQALGWSEEIEGYLNALSADDGKEESDVTA